jgi:two-component system response regulator FixJ
MVATITVHVIDDDEAMRDSLSLLLSSADLGVRTYASAEDFLEALPVSGRGCVISDVQMPRMDGLGLLRRLRAADFQLPVILMSGGSERSMAAKAMESGAVGFMEKPFPAAALLASIEAAVA